MNIGIDVSVLEKGMTGIGRYLLGILKYLPETDNKNRYYLFSYKTPYYGNKFYRIVSTGKYLPSKLYSPFWLNIVLPQSLSKYNIKLLFSPNHLTPIKLNKSKWHSIITIHDICHKIDHSYKDLFYRNYLDIFLPIAIKNCEKIITVSQFSKKELIRYYNIPSDKIFVIYEFASEIFKPRIINKEMRDNLMRKLSIPEEYILYVGVIENRKNILGILRISDILKNKRLRTKIILAGKPGLGFNEMIKEIKRRDNVIYLSYINDELLPYLYNLAKLFLFPSFYEGFGLPPLEAMQSGIPVLTSNVSSLPEVVGEGGIMHSPDDYEAFAEDIVRLIEDRTFYEVMSKKALAQASKFNPYKSIRALVEVFNI